MKIASAIWNSSLFGPSYAAIEPEDLEGADLLLLHGGEDISPSLYGDPVVASHATEHPSERDRIEVGLTKEAIRLGIPIFGICRGHQLLAAVSGGKLYQHVSNHVLGSHPLVFEGKEYSTNSCHHQLVIPNDDMEVLAYAPCRSRIKVTTKEIVDEGDEAEIIFYPTINALGVQGHPEWLPRNHDLNKIVRQLLETKLKRSV